MWRPPLTIAEAKRRYSIDQVLQALDVLDLPDQNGQEWQAMVCPFHDDRTASASVSYVHDRFRCHACGIAGDQVGLVCEVENITPREALQWLQTKMESTFDTTVDWTGYDDEA